MVGTVDSGQFFVDLSDSLLESPYDSIEDLAKRDDDYCSVEATKHLGFSLGCHAHAS
jgi:hypothetical protein